MIRAAVMQDVSKIADLFYKSMPSPWKFEDIKSALSSPSMSAWVLEENDLLKCAVLLQVCLDEAEILSIATDPSERRKGHAKNLLSYVLRELGQETNVFLEVREKNENAIHFYESMHFSVYGMRKGYYKSPPDNAVLMKLSKI